MFVNSNVLIKKCGMYHFPLSMKHCIMIYWFEADSDWKSKWFQFTARAQSNYIWFSFHTLGWVQTILKLYGACAIRIMCSNRAVNKLLLNSLVFHHKSHRFLSSLLIVISASRSWEFRLYRSFVGYLKMKLIIPECILIKIQLKTHGNSMLRRLFDS